MSVHRALIGRYSLELGDNCKPRRFGKSGVETPLLVPAFSSTVFAKASDVGQAIEDLKLQITVSSLVSAYDIDRGWVKREIEVSDTVIIDSGTYEKRRLENLGCEIEWTEDQLVAAIDSLNPLTRVAIVNYDRPGPILQQLKSAKVFFEKKPEYLTDFLCKPVVGSSYLDIESMKKHLDGFADFDALGVTEQELGPSFIEKCKSLGRLRQYLDSEGIDLPIHVFGCFEPMKTLLLCLMGGDIFDGLSWARYTIRGDSLLYNGSIPIIDEQWSTDDSLIERRSASHNLDQMTDLMFKLRTFSRGNDFSHLGLTQSMESVVRTILDQAAKEIGRIRD